MAKKEKKPKLTVDEFLRTLNDTSRAALQEVCKQAAAEYLAQQESREQLKEILIAGAETFQIEPSVLRKVSRLYFRKNASEFEQENNEIVALYAEITK